MVWDVVFLELNEELRSHFFFRKFKSTERAWMGLSSKDKNFAVMSSQTNTKVPPQFWSRTRWNGEEYPGILNWLPGNESSIFVSEMTITSTFPVTWSARISNLFPKEFLLRWAKTVRLRFFIQISFRPLTETTLSYKRSGCSILDSHSFNNIYFKTVWISIISKSRSQISEKVASLQRGTILIQM